MMGVSGNESILNREKVLHEGNVVDIPVLSGNALRHKIIREPGALHLVDVCELRGKLSIDQANYMFTGGSLSESSTTDNIPLIAELQEVSPLFRLLGGSLKNQVVGGSLFVSRGILICLENQKLLPKLIPEDYEIPVQSLLPAQHFISKYQYTRGDAGRMKDSVSMIKDLQKKEESNLMIYAGESIVPGTLFYHDLILYNVSPLEIGATLFCIQRWQKSDGIIGGSARIGHGKMKSNIWISGLVDWFGHEKDPDELIQEYIQHVEKNKDRFVSWLEKAFPTKMSFPIIKKVKDSLIYIFEEKQPDGSLIDVQRYIGIAVDNSKDGKSIAKAIGNKIKAAKSPEDIFKDFEGMSIIRNDYDSVLSFFEEQL
jgi:hypothetical protein